MADLLDCIEVQTHANPTAAVVWLHGLGADGYDFVPVVRELEAAGAPAARYVFPHAPQIPVTINSGYVMRAWYDILGTELVRHEDGARIRASADAVEQLIAREVARGIPRQRIVLAGFSQGGAITLHAGLRSTQPLAGLMPLSTYLPLADQARVEATAASKSVPIFMAHGAQDPVIPLQRATASRDTLKSLGYNVEWHEYAMQHSVNGDEIADIARFLQRVIK